MNVFLVENEIVRWVCVVDPLGMMRCATWYLHQTPRTHVSISLLDQVDIQISDTPLGLGEQGVTFLGKPRVNQGQSGFLIKGLHQDIRWLFLGMVAVGKLFFRHPIGRVNPIVPGRMLPKLGLVVWGASSEMDCSMVILVGTSNTRLGRNNMTEDLGKIR